MKRRQLSTRVGLVITAVLAGLLLIAGGCGGGGGQRKAAEVQTGSLKRTFTLVDDQGRKSGTLVLNPLGGAELRDADGQLVGNFVDARGNGAPKATE